MFLIITPTHTRTTPAPWCHWCLGKRHAGMCKPLALAMADPPDIVIAIEEAPDEYPED